jgi:hypothetical protein
MKPGSSGSKASEDFGEAHPRCAGSGVRSIDSGMTATLVPVTAMELEALLVWLRHVKPLPLP